MRTVIIGGGASGVFSGITIKTAKPKMDVIILEQNNKLLKKVLKTGSGKCNISNEHINKDKYDNFTLIEENKQINVSKILDNYGFLLRQDSVGRLYPYNLSSKCVVRILQDKIDELGINCKLNYEVKSIKKKNNLFIINNEIECDYVVIATGSKAQEKTCGYELAKSLGHSVTTLRPGLVPIKTYENTNNLKGLHWKCSMKCNDFCDTGEVLFREDGLSGIITLDASNHLQEGDIIHIDLMPDYSFDVLNEIADKRGIMYIKNIFPSPLWEEIKKRSQKDGYYISTIKDLTYTVYEKKGFEDAQITLGGIKTLEIDKNFESKKQKNMFIVGEVLDVAGSTGGYNLHFAWLSGYVAGKAIAKKL